jgi:hypothetical protein
MAEPSLRNKLANNRSGPPCCCLGPTENREAVQLRVISNGAFNDWNQIGGCNTSYSVAGNHLSRKAVGSRGR